MRSMLSGLKRKKFIRNLHIRDSCDLVNETLHQMLSICKVFFQCFSMFSIYCALLVLHLILFIRAAAKEYAIETIHKTEIGIDRTFVDETRVIQNVEKPFRIEGKQYFRNTVNICKYMLLV